MKIILNREDNYFLLVNFTKKKLKNRIKFDNLDNFFRRPITQLSLFDIDCQYFTPEGSLEGNADSITKRMKKINSQSVCFIRDLFRDFRKLSRFNNSRTFK